MQSDKYYDLWSDYVRRDPPPSRVYRLWYAQLKARQDAVLSIGRMKRFFVQNSTILSVQRQPHSQAWATALHPCLLAYLLTFPASPAAPKRRSRSRSRAPTRSRSRKRPSRRSSKKKPVRT